MTLKYNTWKDTECGVPFSRVSSLRGPRHVQAIEGRLEQGQAVVPGSTSTRECGGYATRTPTAEPKVPARRIKGKEAEISCRGHLPVENRNGPIMSLGPTKPRRHGAKHELDLLVSPFASKHHVYGLEDDAQIEA